MEIQALSQLFPLFSTASPDTLNWIIEIATQEEYHPDQIILTPEDWGKATYFILSGWVKLQYLSTEKSITQTVVGKGDFFGESAILEDSPENTRVVALTKVNLFTISAQRFIQILFQDSKLQHRLLQLTIKRLKTLSNHWQLRQQPPVIRLVKVLVCLAENYGQFDEDKGAVIVPVPLIDLAELTDIEIDEIAKIITKLQKNNWIDLDNDNRTLYLKNIKQLINFSEKVS